MPRLQHLFCSGFCLINIAAFSQGLPKHPTSQQIAGYQLHQQQQWISSQQPKNSVLYQNGAGSAGSLQFTFGKKKESAPLFQTPVGYLPQVTQLNQVNQTASAHEKIPPVAQFNAWKNFSKWKHLFDGGSHLGLISF